MDDEELGMLEECLRELDAYEDNLTSEQMRELYGVFMSSFCTDKVEPRSNQSDNETSCIEDTVNTFAIESNEMHNSTMIHHNYDCNPIDDTKNGFEHVNIFHSPSPCGELSQSVTDFKKSNQDFSDDEDDEVPLKIVVRADVHHDFTYDPVNMSLSDDETKIYRSLKDVSTSSTKEYNMHISSPLENKRLKFDGNNDSGVEVTVASSNLKV